MASMQRRRMKVCCGWIGPGGDGAGVLASVLLAVT
uniref:Uncharacterized protein n=1 Tax=Anguilla anguilla TaxID=7936 RepID=A0A0E9TVF8_ANGAN